MNKLVLCSVGASITNNCSVDVKKVLREDKPWNDENLEKMRKGIQDALDQKNYRSLSLEELSALSAELNSLHKLGISEGDKVVLLASDSLSGQVCADKIKECLFNCFGLKESDIHIVRIEGLQVNDGKRLREEGLKNLVKELLKYLANDNYRYSWDIIINPTGGFKGVVPFLTIMGMLFGRRSVYIFEFSKQLITLPPLPFSFDLNIYDRVRDALLLLEDRVAMQEQEFLSRIKDYVPEEHDLFSAFTEPFDDTGQITLSPLAYCLTQMDSPAQSCFVSENVLDSIHKMAPAQQDKVNHLLDNVASPVWRNSHLHRINTSELLVIKPGNTPERFAGFMKDGMFYVALVYVDHQEYDRDLSNHCIADFQDSNFCKWEVSR